MADFKSFKELANYLDRTEKRVKTVKKRAVTAATKHIRDSIRKMHGQNQPGWAKSMFNPSSPLRRTGKLAKAVNYKVNAAGTEGTVYTDKEWLAIIHEYGVTFKMTDAQRRYLFGVVIKNPRGPGRPRKTHGTGLIHIPARPIWSRVLRQEEGRVQSIIDSYLDDLFE